MNHGLAKKQFSAMHQIAWKPHNHPQSLAVLGKLLNDKAISFLDYAWAVNQLQKEKEKSDEKALALCHLLKSAKAGHLCVVLNKDNSVSPSAHKLWEGPESTVLLSELDQKIYLGLRMLSDSLVNSGESISDKAIYREQNRFYLKRNWQAETQILSHLNRLKNSEPKLKIDLYKIDPVLEDLKSKGILNLKQKEAISQAFTHPLTLISGGPGTGKSYTAAYLIKLFLDSFEDETRTKINIAIASPTGKAAALLQANLNRLVPYKIPTVKTLHRLLQIKNRADNDRIAIPLNADLVLIDECTMIDAHLYSELLQSIKSGARLILIGDPKQLPSVEAGSIFTDILCSASIPQIQLDVCVRTDVPSILKFAEAVHKGDVGCALDLLEKKDQNLERLPISLDGVHAKKAIWNYLQNQYYDFQYEFENPQALFEKFNRLRILTPLRTGPFGTVELNKFIVNQLRANSIERGWLVHPIMITENDYRLDLFNGENGLLFRKLSQGSIDEDFAWFPSERRLPAGLLPAYEYAYALSIHKSQGSEFENVLLILPEGSENFGREVLYTAVTRAKKSLKIIGTDETFKKTLAERSHRHSGLKDKML